MMRLGITGGDGFLGWHLRAYLHHRKDITVKVAGRPCFAAKQSLMDFVRGLDAVIHFAGMNRGEESEIERTNLALTHALIEACAAEAVSPHIVFANSTHFDRDTAYARSKREAASLLEEWAARTVGARFTNLVLPGVFGEHGRPFYNSVVSTFCHQLAFGETPVVQEDREIELVHAQEVAQIIMQVVDARQAGPVSVSGHQVSVSRLLERLRGMAEDYQASLLPEVSAPFDLALFNTYRSYLFPHRYPVPLALRSDARGGLFEAVKTLHGGQCFLSTTHPGITRGNHYHAAKLERFLVIQGEARIQIRRLFSTKVETFLVSGEQPAYIDMPTFHTHNILNVGAGELTTLFWAQEIFDPACPDTYNEPV